MIKPVLISESGGVGKTGAVIEACRDLGIEPKIIYVTCPELQQALKRILQTD